MKDFAEVQYDKAALIFTMWDYWKPDDNQSREKLAVFIDALLRHSNGGDNVKDAAWLMQDSGKWGTVNAIDDIGFAINAMNMQSTAENDFSLFLDGDHTKNLFSKATEHIIETNFYLGVSIEIKQLQCNDKKKEAVLSIQFRISNFWSDFDGWAPKENSSTPNPMAMSPSIAVELLRDSFGHYAQLLIQIKNKCEIEDIEIKFRDTRIGITMLPPMFYYICPCGGLPDHGDAYLLDKGLRSALNPLAKDILGTPDLNATEVSVGILQGCLTIFRHAFEDIRPNGSPVHYEKYLLLPIADHKNTDIEEGLINASTTLSWLDFSFARRVLDVTQRIERDTPFIDRWKDTIDDGIELTKLNYPNLRISKGSVVTDRMFVLLHFIQSFIAKLEMRALIPLNDRSNDIQTIRLILDSTKREAERELTVAPLSGNISNEILAPALGRTRCFGIIDEYVKQSSNDASRRLSQIKGFTKAVSYGGMREEKEHVKTEERDSKRISLILFFLAIMAVLPMISGQYNWPEVTTFFFGNTNSPIWLPVWLISVAVVVGGTLYGVFGASKPERSECIEKLEKDSEELFNINTEYQKIKDENNPSFEELDNKAGKTFISTLIQANSWKHEAHALALSEQDDNQQRYIELRVASYVLQGDVLDLRPDTLKLPITLTLLLAHEHDLNYNNKVELGAELRADLEGIIRDHTQEDIIDGLKQYVKDGDAQTKQTGSSLSKELQRVHNLILDLFSDCQLFNKAYHQKMIDTIKNIFQIIKQTITEKSKRIMQQLFCSKEAIQRRSNTKEDNADKQSLKRQALAVKALRLLIQNGNKDAFQALFDLTKGNNKDEDNKDVLQALADLIPIIVNFAQHDCEEAIPALVYLVQTGDKEAIPALVYLAENGCKEAVQALQALNPEDEVPDTI
ncbi:MAG: hypothetical protein R8J85_09240 [Mariprofundales bacterium]